MKIVAEIGTAHNGDLNRAKQFIDTAKDCGADNIKLQYVYANEILHPKAGIVPLPSGNIELYKSFEKLECSVQFYAQLKEYSEKIGIGFICSPFGLKSLSELALLNPHYYKVASPELNYYELLNEINKICKNNNKEVILSSGVSTLSDIEKALSCFDNKEIITLLHCITCYPAPEDEYNILVIKNLRNIFGVKTGVSDHSLNPELIPLLSLAYNAVMLEKHIALSNSDDGLDDKVALNPDKFKIMCESIRKFESATSVEIITYLSKKYGQERVTACIGDGIKKLSNSEKDNYLRTNRSIHYMKDLKKGHIITKNDIAVLRTEKILSPGISPEFIDIVTDAKLTKDVYDGDGVQFSDIISSI